MPTIVEKINNDMKDAMKSGDKLKLETLRMMKSKIMQVNARGDVPDKEAQQILTKYTKTLKEVIAVAEQNGKTEAAEQAKKELVIVKAFLPEEMTEEQIKAKVQEVITGLGAVTVKDMGKVMKECMVKIQGADGNMVKKFVGELLPK